MFYSDGDGFMQENFKILESTRELNVKLSLISLWMEVMVLEDQDM